MIDAKYDTILTPLSIDLSTGVVITPRAINYTFSGIFDDTLSFDLRAYNIETVMAEKVETILRRSVFNTRARDFYDTYIPKQMTAPVPISVLRFAAPVFVACTLKTN